MTILENDFFVSQLASLHPPTLTDLAKKIPFSCNY